MESKSILSSILLLFLDFLPRLFLFDSPTASFEVVRYLHVVSSNTCRCLPGWLAYRIIAGSQVQCSEKPSLVSLTLSSARVPASRSRLPPNTMIKYCVDQTSPEWQAPSSGDKISWECRWSMVWQQLRQAKIT